MSLNKYQILLKVVEAGSLTRAGEMLNLTQSAVSHAIASLEQELGMNLVIRSRSGVRLTHDGQHLWPYIQQIVQAQAKLKQEVDAIQGLETGTVTIGTFSSVSIHLLPDILESFQARYPLVEIRLQDGHYQEIEGWIADGTVDFGFVHMPAASGLDQTPLHRDRMLGILPPRHALKAAESIALEEIAEEPFIMPAQGCDDDVRALFSGLGLKPKVKFELEDDYAIMAMVQRGLGVSVLPEMIVRGVPYEICVRPLEPAAYRTIGLAALSFKKASPAAAKAMQWIIENYRSDIPGDAG